MRATNIRYALYALLAIWGVYVLIPPLQHAISTVYEGIASGLHGVYRDYADAISPLLIWVSANRGVIAAIIILILIGFFIWSIIVGLRQSRLRDKDEVFGDPERTKGGWYWMICGLCSLALIWFYFSWGAARAFFPHSANEVCQVATLTTAVRPITGALPPRYFTGTEVVVATHNEIAEINDLMGQISLSAADMTEVDRLTAEINALMAELSDPGRVPTAMPASCMISAMVI